MKNTLSCLLVVLSILGCQTKSPRRANPEPGLYQAAPVRDTLTTVEQAAIDSIEATLRWYARRSSSADTLWKYYRVHARRAVNLDGVNCIPVDSLRSPLDFYVTVMPYEAPTGDQMGKVASYNPVSNRFGISRTPLQLRARGVIVLHEMKHVIDYLVDHQVLAPKGTAAWYNAEMIAYSSTSKILNQATHGGWNREVVQPSLADRDEFKRNSGLTPWSFTWAAGPNDSIRVAKVWGRMPHLETNVFTSQLDYDVNMLTVDQNTVGNSAARQRGQLLLMERYCGVVPR